MSSEKSNGATLDLAAAPDNFEIVEASTFDDDTTLSLPPTPMDSALRAVTEAMEALNETFDSKITAIDGNLCTVLDSMKKSDENLESKISSLDYSLKEAVKALKSSNETMTSVKLAIDGMNESMSTIKWELEEERKKKTLERAMMFTDLNSFKYHELEGGSWVEKSSSDLAKKTIQSFLLGLESKLPPARVGSSLLSSTSLAFRSKFTTQIGVDQAGPSCNWGRCFRIHNALQLNGSRLSSPKESVYVCGERKLLLSLKHLRIEDLQRGQLRRDSQNGVCR